MNDLPVEFLTDNAGVIEMQLVEDLKDAILNKNYLRAAILESKLNDLNIRLEYIYEQ